MKHCFIINPASGKANTKVELEAKIREACVAAGAEHTVIYTESIGDARLRILDFYEANKDSSEEIRFYACGGDGTLCETVGGVMALPDTENVSLGVIPVGTGNDFVRNFSSKERFHDISAQLNGKTVKIDLIKCNDMYAVNMINIGFDCHVVVKTNQVKRKRFMPSKLAYICGLVMTLIKKPGVKMTLTVDGKEERLELLLSTYANGCFCGGGFHSNPTAKLCDGQIDTLLVNDVTRIKFLSLVGEYKKGTHLSGKYNDILRSVKNREYDIRFDEPTPVSIDGELVTVDSIHMECLPAALSFIVPDGVSAPVLSSLRETVSV